MLLACAVLLVAPWPVYRLLSIPHFRREYPCLALRGALAVTACVAVVATLATWLPRSLAPLAALCALALLAERWRARRGFGRSGKLPPGSLTLVPRGPWTDERFFAREFSRHGPVFKMSQYFRPMVCLYGPRDGVALLRQHGEALAPTVVRFSSLIPRGFIRYMAPGDHARYRPLFVAAFGRPVVDACLDDIASTVNQQLSEFAADSRTVTGQGLHPEPFLSELLFVCVVRMFSGVSEHDAAFIALRNAYNDLAVGKSACSKVRDQREVGDAIVRTLAAQASKGEADLPPCALRELLRREPALADDRTAMLNLAYMIQFARIDLTGFLMWAVKLLIDHPPWAERLGQEQGAGLADAVISEMLRLERSEFLFRKATADIEFGGYRIPRGWFVRICIRDGHRDPRTFDNPDAFDPQRFVHRTYRAEEYSPLGVGARACPGGRVIDAVAKTFLLAWSRQYTVTVHADGPREYGSAHWQPSSALRISLEDRVPTAR